MDKKNILLNLQHISEIQSNLHQGLKPIYNLQNQIKSLATLLRQLSPPSPALQRLASFQLNTIKSIKLAATVPNAQIIKKFAQIGRDIKLMEDAGWLPHYTTPFELIDNCEDNPAKLDKELTEYYQANWRSIRETIHQRFEIYEIDREAKSTFSEALDAHGAGLYRCVSRVLFPEIERISRIEFHENQITQITSQHELRKLAEELTLDDTEPRGYFGFMLFKCLTEHLYDYVENNIKREKISNNPVPNRHAVVHGLITYSSFTNSLNTLFIVDFIFQIFSFIEKNRPT